MSVTVDGEPTFSGLMNAGEKRQVSAREESSRERRRRRRVRLHLERQTGQAARRAGRSREQANHLSNYKDYITP